MKRVFVVTILALIALQSLATAQAAAPTVQTAYGKISGVEERGAHAYLGIPYAQPPVGDLRWRAPVKPVSWNGVRDGSHFGSNCLQRDATAFGPYTSEYLIQPPTSEDCLYLNVWTPAKPNRALPVLVWIHGGGYMSGSASIPIYNGAHLAQKGVIVVNLNYRLGALGFMAHPELTTEQGGSGSYGILDQIEALRWVQQNIAAFGGDPAKVTVGGQSAGARSVQALLAAPAAKGLFRAALIESTITLEPFPARDQAEGLGRDIVKQLGAASIREARSVPAQTFLTLRARTEPVADGVAIPKNTSGSASEASDVPILVGYTLHDIFTPLRTVSKAEWKADVQTRFGAQAGVAESLYPASTDAEASASANREVADRTYLLPLKAWVDGKTHRSTVYAYLFSHAEPGPGVEKYGAFHSAEIPYLFQTLDLSPNRNFTPVDHHVADRFSSYVANFVKSGNPNGGGLPQWAPLSGAGEVLVVGGTPARSEKISDQKQAVLAAGRPPASVPSTMGLPPPTPATAAPAGRPSDH